MFRLLFINLFLYIPISTLLAIQPVDVVDLHLKACKEKVLYYKFAPGDTVVLNIEETQGKKGIGDIGETVSEAFKGKGVLEKVGKIAGEFLKSTEKKGIREVVIEEWPSSVKFQVRDVDSLKNKRFVNPSLSVYAFKVRFNTSAISKGKTYRIHISRIPAKENLIQFNTTVKWDTICDTLAEEIVNVQKHLGVGGLFSAPNFSYIEFRLPENTAWWVYWIGVGKESAEGLEKMAKHLPKAAALLGITNPVTAFALGLIPELFSATGRLDISYSFTKGTKSSTPFKEGRRVVTEYAKMDNPKQGKIFLLLDNSYSRKTSKYVTVKIVAVKILKKVEPRLSE